MQEKPVDRLQRDLLQVFVGAMDRVAGLESDHGLPTTRAFDGTHLRWREVVRREARCRMRKRNDTALHRP